MKVKLQIRRDGTAVYEGSYDVADAASFGAACADVWNQPEEQRLARATSIGALYHELGDSLVKESLGAEIRLSEA